MVSWYRQWLSQLLAAFFLPGTQIGFWNYSSELANKISVLLHTKNDRACSNSVCNVVVCQSLSRVWLWDHMHCSTPGFPVLHYLPESAKTHVQWVDDAIQPSCCPLYPYLQSFPASGSFPKRRLIALGGQSIGASTSASVLPMNIQDWFPLGLSGLISSQSKGLSRVLSRTTVRKHRFFGTWSSLWSNSDIRVFYSFQPNILFVTDGSNISAYKFHTENILHSASLIWQWSSPFPWQHYVSIIVRQIKM